MSGFKSPETSVPAIASSVVGDTKMKGGSPCATPITDVESLSRTLGNISLVYPDNEMFQSTPADVSIPETPRSTYKPPESSDNSGDETTPSGTSREKLDEFLSSRDISPIRSKLNTAWHLTKERTKRHYTRKARQAVHAVLDEIAPGDTDSLWEALKTSRSVTRQFPLAIEDQADMSLIEALTECYNNAGHWSTRRQILSIMADKVSFKVLKRWIPDLSRYRFNIARHHQLLHGRGAVMQNAQHTRMYVAPGQLSHFLNFITSPHIVQDLPFGERKLKLSSNEELTIPNVIRTIIPAQIILQYEDVCNEEDFKPMGRSTLYRIMHVCSASIRKSLQGLDYVGEQGSKAFEELELAAEKRGDNCGLGLSWAKDKKEQLKLAKQYLKGDFKVHISKSSTVPDHCRAYALSDPDEPFYTAACDHTHGEICDRCLLLSSVVSEIEEGLERAECTVNEREDLTFIVSQAKQNIGSWKAHLLRSTNQDECRLDILNGLDSSSILLVLDWAMKFLPRKFRESQADWFAKRGVPWHLSVAIRRSNSGEIEMITFAHVFESATAQNSSTVLATLDDVFSQLKTVMPELQTIHLRHDNAGCYHCAQTLITAPQIAKRHGLEISRIDLSDPQGGKGSCDRKAATIKSHMAQYLNSGHDIETAAQMKEAIESSGGVRGVSVKVCSPPTNPSSKSIKWEKVSYISNLLYSQDGIRTWRAYDIGPGKCIPWTKFYIPEESELPTIEVSPLSSEVSANFVPVRPRRTSHQPSVAETEDHSDSESDAASGAGESRLFVCPEEGCIKSFIRHSSLAKHLDCGKHKRTLEHETLYDKAMIEYATKLDCGASKAPTIMEGSGSSLATTNLTMGWALKSSRSRRTKFSDKQKQYLNAKFQIGERTNKKADPSNVSKAMRTANDSNGARLFGTADFLTSQQISSYFSRLAAKRSVAEMVVQPDSEDETPEADLHTTLRDKVLSEVSIQHSHPIIYDSYNICDLVLSSKLSSFSVSMLRNICEAFGLDTSEIIVRRKKPFADLLLDLVQGCSCNGKR